MNLTPTILYSSWNKPIINYPSFKCLIIAFKRHSLWPTETTMTRNVRTNLTIFYKILIVLFCFNILWDAPSANNTVLPLRTCRLLFIANIAPGMHWFPIQMPEPLLTRTKFPTSSTSLKLNKPSWSLAISGSLFCSFFFYFKQHRYLNAN